MEQCFPHVEKRQSKISFNSKCLSLMASRACPEADTRKWSACTPLVLQVKDPITSPPRTDIAMGLARCYRTHTHKQNKDLRVKPGTGKDIAKQRDMPSLGCEGSLCLC